MQLRHGSRRAPLHKALPVLGAGRSEPHSGEFAPFFSFLKKNRVNADAISRQHTLSLGRSVKSAFETAELKASSEIVLCRRDQMECSRDAP